MRASFDSLNSSIELDGTKQHAPVFTNLSATPVDDSWAGNQPFGGMAMNTGITITLTHEPAS